MMKRVLGVALSISLAAGAFAGCAKKEAAGNDGTVTVTLWTGSSSDFEVRKAFVDEWNKTTGKKNGVKIDYQLKAGDTLTQSLEVALKAGNAPDFFYGGSMQSYAENGYIAAIEDLKDGDKLIDKLKDKIDDENNKVDGKTYTLPYGTNLRGIVYNKDLFKKAGIVDEKGEAKPPKTFDEYREYAKKLTDAKNGQYGAVFAMKWNGWFGSDINTLVQGSAGHTGYNPTDGKYEYDAFAKIMQYNIDIYKDGSVYPDMEGLDNDTARALFAEGKIGMKMAYDFDVGVLNNQFPAKCDWGVAPMPVLDENNCYYQRMTYGMSPYINKKSLETKHDAVSLAFAFFMSDEYVEFLYKSGCKYPLDYSVVENTKLPSDAPKGWREFGEMLKYSHINNHEPKYDTTNLKTIGDRFLEECWTGKKKPQQVTDEFVKDLYAAQAEYYKNNPDESPDIYIIPDWNIKRK